MRLIFFNFQKTLEHLHGVHPPSFVPELSVRVPGVADVHQVVQVLRQLGRRHLCLLRTLRPLHPHHLHQHGPLQSQRSRAGMRALSFRR